MAVFVFVVVGCWNILQHRFSIFPCLEPFLQIPNNFPSLVCQLATLTVTHFSKDPVLLQPTEVTAQIRVDPDRFMIHSSLPLFYYPALGT